MPISGGGAAASSAHRTENNAKRIDGITKMKRIYDHDNEKRHQFNHPSNSGYRMGETTSVTVGEDSSYRHISPCSASSKPWELGDPRRHVDGIGKLRDACGWFVNSKTMQTCMTTLIVANALLLGILTFDGVKNNESLNSALEVLDLVILSLFTAEFMLQLVYLGFSLVQHKWLVFDCIVVFFSWLFLDSSVAVLRSVRIFRIFSLVSKWESLRLLFAAVGKTMPKMASIWLALMIFFYIFSVLCTTLYADLYDDGFLDHDYFGRLDYTFITLFQIMTLDSWLSVVRQVMHAQPWAWITFFAWVVITAFFVLNLVVAVICESLMEIHQSKDKEEAGSVIEENDNKATATALQMEELIQQQHHMLGVQQDLIRTQVEMQQTLTMIMLNMDTNNAATARPQNSMLFEDSLHRFHSSNESISSFPER